MPQAIPGIYENGVVRPLEKVHIGTDRADVIILFPDKRKQLRRKRLDKFPVGDLGKVNEKLIAREAVYDDYLSDRL